MAFNGSQLLPGQSAPLEIITATDQSGVILIVAALGLIFAIVSLLIRAYLQYGIHHRVSRDDIAVFLAMLFSVAQSSAVFVEIKKGFGKTLVDIPSSNLDSLQRASYASDLLYIFAIWLTKCSVGFLTFRISPNKNHTFAATVVVIMSTLFAVISIFIVALACDLSQPWIFINTNWGHNMILRWQIVAAFDIITEVALFGISIFLVMNLQLKTSKKSIVIFAFALRLPIIAAILVRLHYISRELTSSDPTLQGSLTAIVTQTQISYAIIACTTPCLRPFMTALSTNYGAPAELRTPGNTKKSESNNSKSNSHSKSHPGSNTGSYALSSLSRQHKTSHSTIVKSQEVPETRWDGVDHHASVVAGDGVSFGSGESIQMIIQKNTEWDVAFEGGRSLSRASDVAHPDATRTISHEV